MIPFYKTPRFEKACLSKLDFPSEITQKLSNWANGNKGILFFAGNVGLGKTYFAAAFVNHLAENKKQFRCISEYQFFGMLRETIQKNWDYEMEIQKICEIPYLIIDDIVTARDQKLSDFQKEALHLLIDMRYNSELPTLITSNLFLDDIRIILGEKIYSRLASSENTIIQLNWLDRRTGETKT